MLARLPANVRAPAWREIAKLILMSAAETSTPALPELACRRHCVERIHARWRDFLAKRAERLEQHRRVGEVCEKVAENILEDLFTSVLDWPLSNFNNQLGRADIVLTDQGIKRLVVEVKRPGSLAWNRRALYSALDQALRYASEQRISTVAISDGVMLYAANIAQGGLVDRVYVSLRAHEPQIDLWWLSVQGIWRDPQPCDAARLRLLAQEAERPTAQAQPGEAAMLIHPKYHLPSECFAYVGDYARPASWKLPYLLTDGAVDTKRLPKAVQCIVSNYRGAKVSGIPEEAIPAVLAKLAHAACRLGHMPPGALNPAPAYRQLAEVMEQFGITAHPASIADA